MTIKQVSVFLENKTGRIHEVTKILSRHGINMQAFSMAETPDFGILRLIVSDVDEAVEILRAADFAVKLTDVICLHCSLTERVRWWWGTAPSEITGESIKQYSRQTPVFFGGEMLENIRVDS